MTISDEMSAWVQCGVILAVGSVLLLLLLRAVRALAERAHFPPLAVRPLVSVIRWAGVVVILGLLVRNIFDVNMLNIIVGTLALIAIGVVAVWSLLSHITSTFLLILLQPFRVQDWIGFPGEEVQGRVVDLNFFYTLLVNDENGEHFIVPNNQFFQKTFRHVPTRKRQTVELHEQLHRKESAEADDGGSEKGSGK